MTTGLGSCLGFEAHPATTSSGATAASASDHPIRRVSDARRQRRRMGCVIVGSVRKRRLLMARVGRRGRGWTRLKGPARKLERAFGGGWREGQPTEQASRASIAQTPRPASRHGPVTRAQGRCNKPFFAAFYRQTAAHPLRRNTLFTLKVIMNQNLTRSPILAMVAAGALAVSLVAVPVSGEPGPRPEPKPSAERPERPKQPRAGGRTGRYLEDASHGAGQARSDRSATGVRSGSRGRPADGPEGFGREAPRRPSSHA